MQNCFPGYHRDPHHTSGSLSTCNVTWYMRMEKWALNEKLHLVDSSNQGHLEDISMVKPSLESF